MAVRHADEILWWQENLPHEDVPPRWSWHLPWDLDRHFKDLDAKRLNPQRHDDREQVPMVENEAAAALRAMR